MEGQRPPEGRIRIVESGPLTPGEKRDPLEGLVLVEVDGDVVCHLPATGARWEIDHSGPDRMPRITVTMIAGKSEVTSRESKEERSG